MSNEKQSKNNKDSFNLISNAPKECKDYIIPAKTLKQTIDSDDENYNIGIIGSFGSGKSSLLKTYKSLINKTSGRKRRKIVSVSLASFFNDETKIDKEKTDEKERYLESIIIQQILYSVSRWKLPSSRINRIGFRIRTIFLFLCAILCSLSFLARNNTAFFGLSEIYDIDKYLVLSGIVFSIVTAILFFLCYPITSIVAKVKNVEIKSEPNIRSTLFDEYLDELLYFFHKTNTTVVIFEDIDRCSTDDIFNRLRTLNITLNNNTWFSKKKNKIHFIYAVKEDLFISSEAKSKFFDVLISLPALLSQDNALNHIKHVLLEHSITTLDGEFLSHIATYIISYRQINNIVNDFILISKTKYKDSLIDKYIAKRLFVVLAYKSIFPYDYSEFLKNDGYLYNYIRKKETEIPLLDKKYEKIYKETHPGDKIKSFFELLSNYFDTASLSLISNFVEGDYKNDEQKLFYDRLKANPDFYDPDVTYLDSVSILNHPSASTYFSSNSFLNISIIQAAFRERKKYSSFLNKFAKTFVNKTSNQKSFVLKCSMLVEDNIDFVFYLFELIAPYYSILSSELKTRGFFEQPSKIKRYLKQVIKNKENGLAHNLATLFTDVLKNNDCADVILCESPKELRKYLLTESFKIKSLNISSYFKSTLKSYKESIYELITSNRFYLNLNNFNKIGVVISNRLKIEAPSISAIAYGASIDDNIKTIKNELSVFIADGKYPENEFGDYSNASKDVIISTLKAFNYQVLRDCIIKTCKPIVLDNASALDIAIIEKMLLEHKILAPISVWKQLSGLSSNVENLLITNVIFDCESIIIDENNKGVVYYDLLYKILNDLRCNYAVAGKILELTCKQHSLSMDKLKNIDAIKCSVDYEYIEFAEQDLNIIPLDFLTTFFLKYEEAIISTPHVIHVDRDRIAHLLENVDKSKCWVIICRMVSEINDDNAFVQKYIDCICENISQFDLLFIVSFITSRFVDNDNRVILLLASYLRIDNLGSVLKTLKEQRVFFRQNDFFVDFKGYLSSHREYGYTFQYSKKHNYYLLRKL